MTVQRFPFDRYWGYNPGGASDRESVEEEGTSPPASPPASQPSSAPTGSNEPLWHTVLKNFLVHKWSNANIKVTSRRSSDNFLAHGQAALQERLDAERSHENVRTKRTKKSWRNSLSRTNLRALTDLNTHKSVARLFLAFIRLVYLSDSIPLCPVVPDHSLADALPPKNTIEQKRNKNQKNILKCTYYQKLSRNVEEEIITNRTHTNHKRTQHKRHLHHRTQHTRTRHRRPMRMTHEHTTIAQCTRRTQEHITNETRKKDNKREKKQKNSDCMLRSQRTSTNVCVDIATLKHNQLKFKSWHFCSEQQTVTSITWLLTRQQLT